MKSKKRYYIENIGGLNQLVETPASKERREKRRFIINTVISSVSAVAAIIAAIIAYVALVRG